MRDESCQVLPSPEQPKTDWDLRRGAFKGAGFEQILGDKITEALLDPRSVDREAFEQVLAEHEVRLRVTERDGWTYSMRRVDNGKWGRRKASSLCDDFMKTKVEEVFDFHQQNASTKEKDSERTGQAQRTEGLGDISSLDVEARRRRGTDEGAHERREQGERAPQGDGRSAERRDEVPERVDLAATRAALADAARRLRLDNYRLVLLDHGDCDRHCRQPADPRGNRNDESFRRNPLGRHHRLLRDDDPAAGDASFLQLTLTLKIREGSEWARAGLTAVTVLTVVYSIILTVAGLESGGGGTVAVAIISILLIAFFWLPQANAWFIRSTEEADRASGMTA